MALIKSISGIRGTLGGLPGTGLTPLDVVRFTTAYAVFIGRQVAGQKKIVVGRDARISGPMVQSLVAGTLTGLGFNVLDLGLSTTPTVEMTVPAVGAAGGIIITASHNGWEWNALKLLNDRGEFLSAADGAEILHLAEAVDAVEAATVDELGSITTVTDALDKHIAAILQHPLTDREAIRNAAFRVVLDPVNSTGATAVPQLLSALGVADVEIINGELDGKFAHNPEPLPEHLRELSAAVVRGGAHLGIAVDPDVDRLCFICEDGTPFGEEYTLVAVADYVLRHHPGGSTVSNLSSTRALRDVTEKWGGRHFGAAVGEVNVVEKMKAEGAVIGGEGNGGVIVPTLHYGRDALAGIALFLSHLAHSGNSISALRQTYPSYALSKNKIELDAESAADVPSILLALSEKYRAQPQNTADGLKIEFDNSWVHLRTSNTEPIMRIYAESTSEETADALAHRLMEDIREAMRQGAAVA